MRFFFLLICCCFLNSILLSQSRFSYGINLQAGLSGKTKKWESHEHVDPTNFNTYRSRRHVLVPAAGMGAWVNYTLGKNIFLQSGLQYMNTGNTAANERRSVFQGPPTRVTYRDYTYSFRAHQLQLPFEANVELGQGNVRPILALGVQLSYEWFGKIYHEDDIDLDDNDRSYVTVWTRKDREMYDFRALNLQPFFGFGFRLNEQMTIRLRQVWKFKEETLRWRTANSVPDDVLFSPIEVPPYRFHTPTTHRKVTTLEITYRLF